MEISVEISKYPADDYLPAIKSFIDRLNTIDGLTVVTNTMSTQVFGDHDLVMNTLRGEMKLSWETYGKGVFVVKFLMDDLRGLADE